MSSNPSAKEQRTDILHRVEKPARYLNGEVNAVHKDDPAIRFAMAFPDIYEVGMSHLGLHVIYNELNSIEDVACERVFAPWIDMEAIMRDEGVPLFTLESQTEVRRYDLLGFTLQYEMSFTNILNLLDLAGVPLRSADRGPEDPLVVGGGPCAYNPEPIAEFFDFIVLGEAEGLLERIVDHYRTWNRGQESRADYLTRLARGGLPGLYVPSLYQVKYLADGRVEAVEPLVEGIPQRVDKHLVVDLDKANYPIRPIVPYIDVVHDRAMVEVFRGCSRGCRFCQAGMIYRPVRERSPERVERLASEILEATGHNEVSLVSLSTTDYTDVEKTLNNLVDCHQDQAIGVSLPSLRVDAFSVGLAQEVQKVRKTGLTFAPEAGTERLRRVINKNVTEEDLYETARRAFEAGWDRLKLYFMIGLPTETEEDLAGIVRLARGVSRIYKEARAEGSGGRRKRPLQLTVSVSSFVPKAQTPFQWEPQDTVERLQEKQESLRQGLRGRGLRFSWHEADLSFLEAVIARGDRRLGRLLERAWRLGARFDAWSEHFDIGIWMRAFDEEGIDPSFYAHRQREEGEVLPWDHLSAGVSRDFLWDERQQALAEVRTEDCRFTTCSDCGVCPGLGVSIDVRPRGG